MLRSLAPLLGCGLMMGLGMGALALASRRRNDEPASTNELATLRAEVAELRRLDDEKTRPSGSTDASD